MSLMAQHGEQGGEEGVVLTEAQKRRRRARSIALAFALGALVVLFYALTIIKVGQHPLPGR
jgi:hypothetical protein